MSKIVKLLIAVLVLGFLVGCGGGGGSSSPSGNNTNSTIIAADPNITLASISSGFPAFDDSGLTHYSTLSGKDYGNVSASQNSTFAGALADKGFDGYGSYYSNNNLTDYYAHVNFPADKISLSISSFPIVTHTDALYASTFPTLNADIVNVFIQKIYFGNFTAEFNAYLGDLSADGWIDISSGGDWQAEKTIGSLTYTWYAYLSGDYSLSYWEISE